MKSGILFPICSLSTFLAGTFFYNAQIKEYQDKIWQKAAPAMSRDIQKCDNAALLNFHCNIKNHFQSPVIHNTNEGQSIVVVHHSRDNENIWYNKDILAELNNNSFKRNNSDNVIELEKKPSIFSYLGSRHRSENNKSTESIEFDDKNMYEALFIPKKIKKTDLEKIHSYLSIKYGISLEGVKYFNSKGDIIWDPEKHRGFEKRPTGIGRDDQNELYQKQSSNQEDRTIVIGRQHIARTNYDNTSVLDNQNFAIWSDNDKDLAFKEKDDMRVMERSWEINFIGSSVPRKGYAVQICKYLMNPGNELLNYWLLIKKKDGSLQKVEGKENEQSIEYAVDFPEDMNSSVFTFATNITDRQIVGSNLPPVKTEGPGNASHDFQYLLYPNPVKMNSPFTVKFPETENLEISIYDGGGRMVSSEKINSKTTVYQNKLGIQGVYLVVLSQNKKLIKAFKVIAN